LQPLIDWLDRNEITSFINQLIQDSKKMKQGTFDFSTWEHNLARKKEENE
jgi:hypothetical protein